MWVEITLYKSAMSADDVFISDSFTEDRRDRDLDNLFMDSLTLPRSPFNPNEPFRLYGNIFQFENKYNYARYRFYDTQESIPIIGRRYYFIDSYIYVNDNVTRIDVTRDYLGQFWYKLNFEGCYPESFTYKTKELTDKIFEAPFESPLYALSNFGNFLSPIISTSKKALSFGVLICTCTKNNINYEEFGTSYPVETVILPFALESSNPDSPIVESVNFEWGGDNAIIWGANNFSSLSRQTTDGFKILSTCISFDVNELFNFSYAGTSSGKDLISVSSKQPLFELGRDSNLLIVKKHNYVQLLPNWVINPDDIYFKKPYQKIMLTCGQDNQAEIDPIILNNLPLNGIMSLLPPYSFSIINPQSPKYDFFPIATITNNNAFFNFNDSYAEWLRNNYNSQIMGLKVSQQTERQNFAISSFAQMSNQLINSVASNNYLGLATSGISLVSQGATMANNRKLQQSIQKLQIADVKNRPNQVSFNNSIVECYAQRRYITIGLYNNVKKSDMINQHRMFGYRTVKYVNNPTDRRHTSFEYIQADNYKLWSADVSLSENDLNMIRQQISGGVRLWYTIPQNPMVNGETK